MNVKLSILFDKRKVLTTGPDAGKCHVKFVLSRYDDKVRIRHYVKTNIFVTATEFKKINGGNPGSNQELQSKQTTLYNLYEQGKEILKDNPFIDFDSFEQELHQVGRYKNPFVLMEAYSKSLRAAGRIGTADYYDSALNSFKSYGKDQNVTLSFSTITPALLHRYEKWMIGKGRSITTVGMYCIAMRRVFKIAIEKRKISDRLYPFGKGKYIIPTAKGRKLALSEDQKNSVLKFRSLVPVVQKAVDLFIFSYFCYGMNFKDIALLKFKDIKDDAIIFDRAKTIETERNRDFIEIPLRLETREIITKWGNFKDSMNPAAYVFPVLRDGLTAGQVDDRVNEFVKDTNKSLITLARHLGIVSLTTYWARHTFATIAWKKGADLIFIQRALGHSDPKTTQRYLDSFDLETKRKVANML